MNRTGLLLALLIISKTGNAAEPWTLERALERALSSNPDAALARARIDLARANLEQANSHFWPQLRFQSSYVRTDNPMQVFGSILNQRAYSSTLDFNDVPDTDNLNVKGMLTMPLYQGGRLRAGRQAAKAGSEAARHDSEAVRNALGFEVARGFFTVQKAREFIQAATAAVQSYQTNTSIAQRRLEAGSLLRTDVLDLEVRLAQGEEDLLSAQNAHALALRALQNLLGIDDPDFAVAEASPEILAPESGDFSGRAELSAAGLREQAAREQVRAARGGYYPQVSAFGSVDYDHGWKFDNGGRSYTVGALLQWDIWDGWLTRGKVSEARANLEMAREERRKVQLALGMETEQARLNLQTARERLRVTERAMQMAEESARLIRSRFEQGNALPSQLMDAESALIAARVRRAEAAADSSIAAAALRKALGLSQLASTSTAAQPN